MPPRRTHPGSAARLARTHLSRLLFPNGEPADLPPTPEAGGERMNLDWTLGVLMANRDVARRMAAEAGFAL